MKYFICEEIVQSVTYFISEYSKIISKYSKKIYELLKKRHKQKPARKKISWNFWDFFKFYMIFNVPVKVDEMLLYCCRMLFMM